MDLLLAGLVHDIGAFSLDLVPGRAGFRRGHDRTCRGRTLAPARGLSLSWNGPRCMVRYHHTPWRELRGIWPGTGRRGVAHVQRHQPGGPGRRPAPQDGGKGFGPRRGAGYLKRSFRDPVRAGDRSRPSSNCVADSGLLWGLMEEMLRVPSAMYPGPGPA